MIGFVGGPSSLPEMEDASKTEAPRKSVSFTDVYSEEREKLFLPVKKTFESFDENFDSDTNPQLSDKLKCLKSYLFKLFGIFPEPATNVCRDV